jgi:hypothetical protein
VEEVKAIGAFLLTILSFPVSIFPQLVCAGKDCDLSKACKAEQAPANLTLGTDRLVRGTVNDPSGASFGVDFEAQLRKQSTGQVLIASRLDDHGRFEFGNVAAGTYRVIVVMKRDGVAKRFGFDQASQLTCSGQTACELKIVLPVGSTDRPENYCSPK